MDLNNEYGTLVIQRKLLPLLKTFHEHCLEYCIDYSLAYGSLLGAVRHNGFIPWDDDVDVIVDRANFEKIQRTIGGHPLLEWDYCSQSSLWLAKIKMSEESNLTGYPPTLDIFIIDNVPNNSIIAKIKLYVLIILQGMIKKKPDLSRFRPFMKFCTFFTWLIGRCFSSKMKYRLYEIASKWGNKTQTKRISCYNTIFGYMGKTFSSSMMSSYSLHPFEDIELFIMKGFDEFLTNTYGDYMKPPKYKVGHHIHPEYSTSYK